MKSTIQYQVNTAVSYSELIARINSAPLKKSQSHRLNDQIAAKEKELTKITRYKQSLYQDWKDGEISQQEYREMKADYERQAAGLSDLLARLTAERKQLSNGVDQQHPALVAFAKYQNIEKLTREILIELVDHIKVYENGNSLIIDKHGSPIIDCDFDDAIKRIVASDAAKKVVIPLLTDTIRKSLTEYIQNLQRGTTTLNTVIKQLIKGKGIDYQEPKKRPSHIVLV